MIKSHLSPLTDRSDFVRVFLNERQHLPAESCRRIGKWSRGLERVFEDVLKEGVRRGEFRSDLDTRLAVLGILGMANGGELVPQRGGGDRSRQRRVRPDDRRWHDEAAEAALARKAGVSARALTPADAAKF
jgi:hypothetical protein